MLLLKLGGSWLLPPRDFPHHYESHPMDHDSISSGHAKKQDLTLMPIAIFAFLVRPAIPDNQCDSFQSRRTSQGKVAVEEVSLARGQMRVRLSLELKACLDRKLVRGQVE